MNPGRTVPASTRRLVDVLLLAVLGAAILGGSPAAAHGEIQSTIPEKNATISKPTDHIIINFTEPPTKASQVIVRDGCGDDIIEELYFEDRVAHVFLKAGEPGEWKVSYRVISAADGHQTKGSYSLNVKGKADCSGAGNGGGNGGGSGDGGNGGDGGGTAAGPGGGGTGGEESSFPVVPIALGSAFVIGLALVARRVAG